MRYNFKDLTGLNFGDYKVLHISKNKTKVGGVYWHCKCVCGKERDILTNKLTSGKSTGCGCKRNEKLWQKRLDNLSGKKFGKLLVIKLSDKKGKRNSWECICDCGNITQVTTSKLKNGHTQSCGCGKLFKPTHRKSKHRIYHIWQDMHKRCSNPKSTGYKIYGGKGIAVCERWDEFENFYEDMHVGYEDTLTLERKEVDKGYYKDNCRWATRQEQAENKTNTIYLTIDGETKRLMEWSKISGIDSKLIRRRVQQSKWNHKEAVFLAPQYKNIKKEK